MFEYYISTVLHLVVLNFDTYPFLKEDLCTFGVLLPEARIRIINRIRITNSTCKKNFYLFFSKLFIVQKHSFLHNKKNNSHQCAPSLQFQHSTVQLCTCYRKKKKNLSSLKSDTVV